MEVQNEQRPLAVTLVPPRAATPGETGFYARFGKRILDLSVSIVALLIMAPLMAVLAVAIKLDSQGPVLFVQERVGKDGRLFRCYKFRTMRTDNDSTIHEEHVRRLIVDNTRPAAGQSLKLRDDPRITFLGRFLRRVSLDELPQFFNVLCGEMSVVGPRPDVPYAVAEYKPWYHARFRVRPGITGYWQVEARNQVSYEEMICMDIAYCERQSLWLDVLLIVKTPLSMLSGGGAG